MIITRVATGVLLAWAVPLLFCGIATAAPHVEDIPALDRAIDREIKADVEETTEDTPHGEHGDSAHHGPTNTNPLEFKKDLALWTAVNLGVLLLVLWRFAWGPIRDALDQREQSIANEIAESQKRNEDARELLAQYEQKLDGAKDEVLAILAQARREAEITGRKIVEAAQEEAKVEHQRALGEIDRATGDALKELARRSADLAVELAGKIVRAELRPDDHARLLDEAVANFAGQGSNGDHSD